MASESKAEIKAVAWMHVIHMEFDQTRTKLTETPHNPFGEPGRDYSEEYRVESHPLVHASAIEDYEEALADKRRLAREIDVALHGEEEAAKRPSLCDLVAPARALREAHLAALRLAAKRDGQLVKQVALKNAALRALAEAQEKTAKDAAPPPETGSGGGEPTLREAAAEMYSILLSGDGASQAQCNRFRKALLTGQPSERVTVSDVQVYAAMAHLGPEPLLRHHVRLALEAAFAIASPAPDWRPPDTAPKNETLRLLIEGSDSPMEDEHPYSRTIGSLSDDGEWSFVGWSWVHDHFLTGSGKVVGWLPFDQGPLSSKTAGQGRRLDGSVDTPPAAPTQGGEP